MKDNQQTTFKKYTDLTVEQVVQVNLTYPKNTDPYKYEYEVNKAGKVVDRYLINNAVVEGLKP